MKNQMKDAAGGSSWAILGAIAIERALEPVAFLATFPAPTCVEHPQCAAAVRLRAAAIALDASLKEVVLLGREMMVAKHGGIQ